MANRSNTSPAVSFAGRDMRFLLSHLRSTNHRMADAAVLSITVCCAHCGIDSDKMVSPPIFLEMEGRLLEGDLERALRPEEAPAGRLTRPDLPVWYLCVRCWFDGVRSGTAAATSRVIEG